MATTQGAAPGTWSLGGLLFDAWLTLGHTTSLTITQHPVETGANISDHAFINPRRFTFGVAYSDVIAAPGGGVSSRSVQAYSKLVALQELRQPLTLVSKYGSYENILIESIEVPDDFRTKYAVKATVNLLQIIMVNTSKTAVSANPHATDSTNKGSVNGQAPRADFVDSAIKWLGSLFHK